MKRLLVWSKGEMDLKGLVLLGASAKPKSTSPIGEFGMGNKDAIATLLRTGHRLTVFIGERLVPIEVRETFFRDVPQKEVFINGVSAGFTLNLGRKWEPWMAIRELVTNAMDEGDYLVTETDDEPEGESGTTRFYVEPIPSQPPWLREKAPFGAIERALLAGVRVYRRGILVWQDRRDSVYDWNLKDIEIDEDRKADGWVVGYDVAAAMAAAPDAIKRAILLQPESWEQSIVGRYSLSKDDGAWKSALGNRVFATREQVAFFAEDRPPNTLVVSDGMAKMLPQGQSILSKLRVRGNAKPLRKPVEPSEMATLSRCLALVRRFASIELKDISFVETFQDDSVQGTCDLTTGKIQVKQGLSFEEMLETLIHEVIHRLSRAEDATRRYESYCVSVIKDLLLERSRKAR